MNEQSLFIAALEKPIDGREKFLSEACPEQPELRGRVQRLLAAHENAERLMARPAVAVEPTIDQPQERPGTKIGRYKLLEQIGEGGMGTVWVAEQTEPVRRRVALKLIKPGMDSRQVLSRFDAERQALALMDHPNIARVLDGGVTDEGRPFFVMELVHGVPITKYCDENKLTPRERLELFVPICQAIQHAHQKGIIHRDIKPTNVLVTMYDDQAVPKVIDFGVAKAVEQRLTEGTLYTQYGVMVGTFEYMSPEQAEMNALGVDTRSDIYSLGVMLYELLTGTTPLEKKRLREAALDEMIRLIREEEPPPPSRRLSTSQTLPSLAAARRMEPARLSKLMRGELDWIVMKCLEKDRKRRYETANGLARDVERYLHDEPVEACPPSTTYRLRKFARKHRTLLASAGGFVALLLTGAAVSSWLAVRATNAERTALLAADSERKAKDAEVNERRRAEASGIEAKAQRDTAVKTNEQLLKTQRNLRSALYGALMNQIPVAWQTGNLNRAHELLAQARPAAGDEDLRGFEYHYWNRDTHGELRTVRLPRMQAFSPVISASGTRMAGVLNQFGRRQRVQVRDTATGNELFSRAIPADHRCLDIEFSSDGSRVAWVERSRDWAESESPAAQPVQVRLQVWDPVRGELLWEKPDLFAAGPGLSQVYLNDDGTRVALIPHAAEEPLPGKDPRTAVSVWEVAGGRELLRQVIDHPLRFVEGNLNPDGTQIAAVVESSEGAENRRLRIWSVADGQERPEMPLGDQFRLGGISFIPQQNRLLVAGTTANSQQGHMQVRDLESGKLATSWSEPQMAVGKRYAISPDGTLVAIASYQSHLLMVRELATGRAILFGRAHERSIDDVAFSADGTRVITVAAQGELKEWAVPQVDSSAPARRQVLRGLAALTLSANGQRLAIFRTATPGAVGRTPGEVAILDADSFQEIARWQADASVIAASPAPAMALSPDGSALAFLSRYREVPYLSVWDVATQAIRFELGPDELGSNLQYYCDLQPFSPDGKLLAISTTTKQESGAGVSQVKIFDSITGELKAALSPPEGAWVNSLAFSPDGRQLAGAGGVATDSLPRGLVTVWDIASGKTTHPFTHPDCVFFAVAFNHLGTQLAAGTGLAGGLVIDTRGQIVLWDLADSRPLHVLTGHSASIFDLAFAPDGRRLASLSPQSSARTSTGLKGEIKLWDVASGQERLSLSVNEGSAFAITFSSDGHQLMTPVWDAPFSSLEVWDATPLPSSIEAYDVIARLIQAAPLREDLVERLRQDDSLADDVRQAALALAKAWPEDSDSLNAASWQVVAQADQPAANYRRALNLAERAVKIVPDDGWIVNTLGVAQYRVGQYAQAKETLTRTLHMNTDSKEGPLAGDLAFLAMACHQLGEKEEAASLLARLRERMKVGFAARNRENQRFLDEAEKLLGSPR